MAGLRYDDLEPRIQIMELRRRATFNLQRMDHRVSQYLDSVFSAIRDASRLKKQEANLPMPPVVEKTSGVKELCSTSRSRCS